jgi:hypothetical protein
MKTFILDIIPKIQGFSKKLDNIAILTNKNWIILDDKLEKKIVFIFREKENQLLISENGKIEKANWEYLGNNTLLIDRKDGSFLFRHGFIDDNILALKVDGKNEYALFVNEDKYNKQLNSINTIQKFLEINYIDKNKKQSVSRSKEIKKFDPNASLQLHLNLISIIEKFKKFDNPQNVEILISYLRDNLIKTEQIENFKEIYEMIVSKLIPIDMVQRLYNENRDNIEYISALEKHLRDQFKKNYS